MARVVWNTDGERELATSRKMKAKLDAVAFTITAHAVPFSGVDTGRLIASMDHGLDEVEGVATAYLGSNASDPTLEPVRYAAYHWADREAPDQPEGPAPRELRKSITHPTRTAPTLPYSNAMRQLGVNFDIEPGGFES